MTMHLGYKRAHADRPLFRWCQRCHLPSQANICSTCKTKPPTKRDAVISDPHPLPTQWACYQPDMSGNSYLEQPDYTSYDISHRGIIWALAQGVHTTHGDHYRIEYQGRLDPETQRSMMAWMRERGATGSNLHNCRLTTKTMDLSICCMGSLTTIELIDYGSPDALPSIPSQVGITVAEMGGAAW